MSNEATAEGMVSYYKSISAWKRPSFLEKLKQEQPQVHKIVVKKLKIEAPKK